MTKKLSLYLTITAILIASITIVNLRLSSIRGTPSALESMAYLPGSERVKPFMLGFNTTYAHYLWIKTMIYCGEHLDSDKQFDWLVQMVDMITRLHPHFNEAYEFAGLMIPDLCRNPDAAKVILERGMNVMGDTKWNVPFYLGMLYNKYYKDPERAAICITAAAQVPSEHSGKLARLASHFYSSAGRGAEALDVLLFLYETSENPEVKRHIEGKIEALVAEGGGVTVNGVDGVNSININKAISVDSANGRPLSE